MEVVDDGYADYSDPAVLDRAFDGINTALIDFPYSERGATEQLNRNAVEAARRAGVGNLVYLSFQGAAPDSTFPPARDYYSVEQLLERSGIPFAALRINLFLDRLPSLFFGGDVARGAAGAGAAAFVSEQDVVRVLAVALSRPDVVHGVVDVTGPEALTLAEVALRLSAIHGRPFRYEVESLAEFHARREQLDPRHQFLQPVWSAYYEAIAAGNLAAVSDTVERLTGRPAESFGTQITPEP
jgi:uncharacterized protein YbjT (DUF2867 family)